MFAAIVIATLVGIGDVYSTPDLDGGGTTDVGSSQGQACKFTLQTDLDPKKEPLVLNVKQTQIRDKDHVEELEIARPAVIDGKGVVTVEANKKLLFACTGRRNNNKVTGQQTAYATCKRGKLMIENSKVNIKSTSCSRMYADSWLKLTDDPCGDGDNTGHLFQIGFELDDHTWFPLVHVCHNITRGVTLYSAHELYGQSIKGGVKSSERRKFSCGPKELYPGVNPDALYKKKGQEKAFDKILGNDGAKMYINDTCFLARGHLAPDADFIYNSGQLLTYYFVNAGPQWQPFNGGNWLSVENAVRDLAAKEKETLNVWTGTYGILELADSNGHKSPIYLNPTDKTVPAPEVYWKIVQHPVTKACTVVAGHNNVFLKKAPTPICDPATPNGWPTLTNLAKGYTYYCDYDSFKERVNFAPTIDCKDIFEFPEVSY